MFLRRISHLTKKTSVRLTFWFSAIFIIAVLMLFALTYLFLSGSIRDKDRRVAGTKLAEYEKLQKTAGLPALLNKIDRDRRADQQAGFYVRVSDSQNRTILETRPPGLTEKDTKEIARTRVSGRRQWFVFHSLDGHSTFEFSTSALSDEVFLQVGFGMVERERLLEHFKKIFFLVMIPLILLSVAGGFLTAHRALGPIKGLVRAIHGVDTGRLEERVPSRGAEDELDEVVRLFNNMLAKIETLVNGMREALSNVAHDLRTPVTRLRVGVETALQAEGDEQYYKEALMDCAEEAERLATILNTLLDVSEAETGTMRLNHRPVNVTDLLEEALELYQYVAEDKEVELDAEMPETLMADLDADRVRQALANLLDNAVKYTPSGGQVRVTSWETNGDAIIEVRDSGPGIPPEDMPRIFERLYRGDKSRSHYGLGLGLSLVQAVVTAHEGRIEVESPPDGGAVFTLYLPKKK